MNLKKIMIPIILVSIFILSIIIAINSIKLGNYFEINSQNDWKVSKDISFIEGKKWSLEYAGGNISSSLELSNSPILSDSISISADTITLTINLLSHYEQSYALDLNSDGMVFSAKLIRNGMTFALQQAGNESGYAVGIDVKI